MSRRTYHVLVSERIPQKVVLQVSEEREKYHIQNLQYSRPGGNTD